MKILITGASGYLGRAVVHRLLGYSKYDLVAAVRNSGLSINGKLEVCEIVGLTSRTDWSTAVSNVNTVIHLAARAHVIREQSKDPIVEFRQVNVEGTLALARQALEAGVKRFVFISSIGVNGSHTDSIPFTEKSRPAPHADYALSKYEAELSLQELVKDTAMELVLIRPPLVYAAHAPGNFARLLKLVGSGFPLPFGLVRNQRSMVALENLIDFIELCIEHPAAANQTFLVSDGVDVSTPQMVQYLAEGMGIKSRMMPVPVGLMRWGAAAVGKQGVIEQLCGSLVIDPAKARELLGWQPLLNPAEALIKAGAEYQNRH